MDYQSILNKRLNNAIEHKAVDRIPCAPLIESYAAIFHGVPIYDFLFNEEIAFQAFHNLKQTYPIWDIKRSIYFFHYGPIQNIIGIMKTKMPDRNSEKENEFQYIEYEAMSREDYNIILNKGYDSYLNTAYYKMFGASPEAISAAKKQTLEMHKKEIYQARLNNQLFLYGARIYFPHSYFSNLRSFQQYVRDIYQIPDIMKEAGRIAMEHCIEEALLTVKETGVPRVMIGPPRINGPFFSTSIFESLYWPDLERCALRLIEEGITPIFHLDGNWEKNLEYFTTLPKNKIIIELDGYTDIFKAKQILGNHSCILGDVPPTLFTLGSPDQVTSYCNALLSEFKNDGGFILGSGCTVPYNSKHENVKAFFEASSKF
ncbi:MAG: uroporphyrinogen decarboxylase family protein [Anaerovoracaceae bacterium]|jgi:uroporphyrinogen-III decarboxylase